MGSRLGEEGDFIPEEIALATLGGRLEVGVPTRDGRERLTVPMSVSSSMVDFHSMCTGAALPFGRRACQPTRTQRLRRRLELSPQL